MRVPMSNSDSNDMVAIRNSSEQVSTHFKMSELFNPKNGLNAHPFSRTCLNALEIIRSYMGVPISVTSTYRNYVPANGANPSAHMLGCAVDFKFAQSGTRLEQIMVYLREDWAGKGELFQKLISAGVTGFGLYDNFVHIDTVNISLYPSFSKKRTATFLGRRYAVWNDMKRLRYLSVREGYFTPAAKISSLPVPTAPAPDPTPIPKPTTPAPKPTVPIPTKIDTLPPNIIVSQASTPPTIPTPTIPVLTEVKEVVEKTTGSIAGWAKEIIQRSEDGIASDASYQNIIFPIFTILTMLITLFVFVWVIRRI